jgi:lipopolysaccharide assembly outer membrane protein LptD (OstA)
VLCWQVFLLAQITSNATGAAIDGISQADTTAAVGDSLRLSPAKEDSLFYAADSVAYDYAGEIIHLYGNTQIDYQEASIGADSMYIDLEREQARTFGKTVMRDQDQILVGTDVRYDVNSQTGILNDGFSRIEQGFYSGAEVRKTGADIYDVDNGSFTTCDAAEPDFWFTAGKLRVYRGDKIVGKPVVAYVNHLPVFYFPFITVSIRRGRHTGFLIPEPGYNTVDGKFIRDIAWYFPYKDFADVTLSMDIMERTGWKLRLITEYIKRYRFNGGFTAAYQRGSSANQTYHDWSLRANHHHEMGGDATFDANIDFVSNKRIWDNSVSLDESLAERLTSSLAFRKPLLGSYLNAGVVYTQDLVNDRTSVSLPSISFSVPGRPLYELFWKPERSPDAWWSNISYNYSARFDHSGEINDPDRTIGDIFWGNEIDPADSTLWLNRHNVGMRHDFGLSYNWKMLGWLNFRQGLNYTEAWFDRDKQDRKWVRGNAYSAYASANFNIYGIRNFTKGKILSLRHILTPSASISYNPDHSSNARFWSFGGIGLSNAKESANLSLTLDQKWQLKYKSGNQEKRINDLLSLSSRTSANLMDDVKNFTQISHTLAFRPGSFSLGQITIPGTKIVFRDINCGYEASFSASHDPWSLSWTDWKLKQQYFSHSIAIGGNAPYKKYFPKAKNMAFEQYDAVDSLQSVSEGFASQESSNSWRLQLSQELYGQKSIFEPSANNLRMDAAVKITDNWSLTYSNYYDMKNSQMISQSFKISRALHCWRLDISYSRRNEFWEYRIVLFNTLLPDALRFQTRDSKTN